MAEGAVRSAEARGSGRHSLSSLASCFRFPGPTHHTHIFRASVPGRLCTSPEDVIYVCVCAQQILTEFFLSANFFTLLFRFHQEAL